jgi:parallel beta-helix repeat protein
MTTGRHQPQPGPCEPLSGNGYSAQGNNFGIGLENTGTNDNIVEDNTVIGNTNGLFMTAEVQGNIIRRNLLEGNPPVQVAVDHASNSGFDIKNLADVGKNLFQGNFCLTAVNAQCPAVSHRAAALLASELQYVACGNYPPVPSCRLNVHEWNWYLTNKVNPGAQVLVTDDNSRVMTVQQYVQARNNAGLF